MQWLFRKAHMTLIIPTRKLTTIDNIISIKLSLHHEKNCNNLSSFWTQVQL